MLSISPNMTRALLRTEYTNTPYTRSGPSQDCGEPRLYRVCKPSLAPVKHTYSVLRTEYRGMSVGTEYLLPQRPPYVLLR